MEKATGFFVVVLAACWSTGSACPAEQTPEPDIVVEITAPRQEEAAAGRSLPTQVITSEEIESALVATAAGALEGSPSVDVRSYGPSSALSLVHLRGASPSQVLILLNGQRLNTLQGGGVDLARLSTLNIERIEVSRGGASSRFGSDAIGGVINIITKSGETAPRLSYSAETGSFGARRASLSLSTKSLTSDHFVSFERSYSNDDFPFAMPDGTSQHRQNAQVSSHYFFSTFGYYPTRDKRLSLTVQNDLSVAGVPGPVEFPSPNAEQEDQRQVILLSYDDFSPSARLRASLYHQRAKRLYTDPDAFPAPINSDHRNQTTSADLTADRPLKAGHLAFGLSWRRDSLDSNNLGQRYADNAAVFANAEVELGPVTLVPEWRKDWQSQFGSWESPGLGLIVELPTENSLTLNLSRSFRAPSFDDLYWPEDNFAVGNPDLLPESASALDVTWDGPNHSVSIFRTKVKDLILWQPVQGGKWSPSNVGQAVMEGVELQAAGKRGKTAFEFNYTFLRAYDATDDPITSGKQLIGRPEHQAHLRLARPLGAWKAALRLDATGKRFYTSANTKALGGYLLADLSLSREMPWLGTLSLSVRNLLDKSYQTIPGYPVPGREVRLRLSKSL